MIGHIMALFLIQQSCTRTLNDILCHSVYISVCGSRPTDKGGVTETLRQEGRAVPNFFLRPFGAQFGVKIRGGGRAGPCPGSATTSNSLCRTKVRHTLKCFFCDKAILYDSQRDLSQLGPHSAYGSS